MENNPNVIEDGRTGALVLYSPCALQLREHIQELAPISEIVIENRIVGEDEVYSASIFGIDVHPRIVYCKTTISRFAKKPTPEEAKEMPLTLIQALRRKFFKETPGKPSVAVPTIVIDNAEFILDWQQHLERKQIIDIEYNSSVPKLTSIFIGETKTELAKMRNVLLSNNLLLALFKPIGESLITVYQDMARF